jgi:carbamoyltransferase
VHYRSAASTTTVLFGKVNSGEYKVISLSPNGQPKYTQLIRDDLIDINPGGSDAAHMDIAVSIQAVTEERVANLIDSVVTSSSPRDLCLAGNVALKGGERQGVALR